MKYFKPFFHVFIVASLGFFTSCAKKEDSKAKQARINKAINTEIEVVQEYLEAGKPNQAISHLEELQSANPHNVEIIKLLAMTYSATGESALASFFFEQVAKLEPTQHEFSVFAALAYHDVNDWDSSARNYEVYLKSSPNDLTAWKTLGLVYETNKQNERALQADLKDASLSQANVFFEENLKIAQLYYKINLPSDSKPWFEKAHKLDKKDTEVLLHLIKIECLEENYASAEFYFKKLQSANPTLVTSSLLCTQIQKIQSWRKSQDKAIALIKTVQYIYAEPLTIELKSTVELVPKAKVNENLTLIDSESEFSDGLFLEGTHESIETLSSDFLEDGEGNGFLPEEINLYTETKHQLPEKELSENEFERAVAENVFLAPQSTSKKTLLSVKPSSMTEEPKVMVRQVPFTAEELLSKDYELRDSGNYDKAIKQYWQGLTIDPKPSTPWHELSQAYFLNKEYTKAEMSVLEATYRNSNSAHFKLNYFKIIQITHPDNSVISELEKSKNKFPQNLDITLALARGYVSLREKRHQARILYEEFINNASIGHPGKTEAQSALGMLH